MVLLHLHCPSGASLRYAVFHTSCSSYSIPHGSFCVLHATSFIPSSFHSFRHVRSQDICFKAWHTIQTHKPTTSDAHTFSQANATILTGLHSVSLRNTFTSVAISPPAAHNFACLSCLLRLRVCHGFCSLTTLHTRKTKTHAKPLRMTLLSTAWLTPFFVATTLQAHARSVHSCLIPVSLVRHAPLATVWPSLPHSYASF